MRSADGVADVAAKRPEARAEGRNPATSQGRRRSVFLIEVDLVVGACPKSVFLPAADAGGHQPDLGVEIKRGDGGGLEEALLGGGEGGGASGGIGEGERAGERGVEGGVGEVRVIFCSA